MRKSDGETDQVFYYFTRKSSVPKILKQGIPKSAEGYVFLWNSLLVAEHRMYAQYLRKGKRMDTATLQVTIPKSWAKSDSGSYYDSELEYYHAFKTQRSIPAGRVELVKYYSHPENQDLSASLSSSDNSLYEISRSKKS